MRRDRVLVTGASGLLGRAIVRIFSSDSDLEVLGAGFSRALPPLVRLDVRSRDEVIRTLDDFAPNILIHAAAERRPDIVEKDPGAAFALNVDTTAMLAAQAAARGIKIVFISTDYVFDGIHPPFFVDSVPNPPNLYGRMKREGELIVARSGAAWSLLRIPMLYGPSTDIGESPVTEPLKRLIPGNAPGAAPIAPFTVDDWATRYPSHVDDVARAVWTICTSGQDGIFQFSGIDAMTKYRMTMIMASIAGFDTNMLLPDPNPSGAVPRPRDCRLDASRLEAAGFSPQIHFEDGIRQVLAGLFPSMKDGFTRRRTETVSVKPYSA